MLAQPARERGEPGVPPERSYAACTMRVPTGRGTVAVTDTGGPGLPLVLLHENSSSRRAFSPLLEGPLGARRRLLAVDLLGHGESDDAREPGGDYTLTGQADAVAEVLERLDVERVAVLGWSLGGHIALELAASIPGVAGVALVGAPPVGATPDTILPAFRPGPAAAILGQQSWDDADIAAYLGASGLAGCAGAADDARRADGRSRAAMLADLLAGGASDERAIVAALRVPLLVALGAEDPIVNRAWIEALPYGSLWRGRIAVLPRCGHAPFLDAPDLFAGLLEAFLADVDASTAESTDSFGGWFGG